MKRLLSAAGLSLLGIAVVGAAPANAAPITCPDGNDTGARWHKGTGDKV